ncbi:hypothetical protein [Micromonospora chersina]
MIWADGQEWGTAAHLADRFQVTVWTVYKWRKRHGLTVHRIGGVDYSPVVDAALIDRDRRDETRGTPRLDAVAA